MRFQNVISFDARAHKNAADVQFEIDSPPFVNIYVSRMLELSLQQRGKTLMTKRIDAEPLSIGRAADNSIRLFDPEISRHHCRIEPMADALRVVDLSMNGTLINGKLHKEADLCAGDKIAIGPWTISVGLASDDAPVKTIAKSAGETRIITFDPDIKSLTTEHIEFIVNSPERSPIRRKLSSGEIVIGHHAGCDISIADPFVSRRHCKVVVGSGAIRIIDLSSTNGTYISGVRVSETPLPASGSFNIGRSTVSYRLVRATEKISPSKNTALCGMIGASRSMRRIFSLIERVGPTDATVCITGESGTGKELAARALHDQSRRRRGPFIAINCGAVPASIIEGQLFGHERGAFTGAVERSAGLFEQAKGGTIFLDEIGEMPIDLQTRLLRVLEMKSVRRVGGQEDIPIDARVICATNKNLKSLVSEGRFREDLFFRIFVVPVDIPPLRDRHQDIAPLAAHFLEALSDCRRRLSITAAAIERLADYSWPGNIRELKNTLERSALLSDRDIIDAADLRIENVEAPRKGSGPLKDHEREVLVAALEETHGNLSRTSRKLGIARTTLQKKIKLHGIPIPQKTRQID